MFNTRIFYNENPFSNEENEVNEFWNLISIELAKLNAEPINFETIYNSDNTVLGYKVFYKVMPFSPRAVNKL